MASAWNYEVVLPLLSFLGRIQMDPRVRKPKDTILLPGQASRTKVFRIYSAGGDIS